MDWLEIGQSDGGISLAIMNSWPITDHLPLPIPPYDAELSVLHFFWRYLFELLSDQP